jgi:hypothetical protein
MDRHPLTRKDQVLPVLQAGGFALVQKREVGHGLARLFDATGTEVPAWQQAITSCLTKCHVTETTARLRRWEIKP